MGKYDPLRDYLAGRSGDEVRMTFSDVECLVGRLPASARDYRAWWANDSKVEAQAWRAAGWHVQSVNLAGETVVFAPSGGHGTPPGTRPSARERIEGAGPGRLPQVDHELSNRPRSLQPALHKRERQTQSSQWTDIPPPGSAHTAQAAVVLVGCVRSKRPAAAAAADLFASPLFAGRRRYATASGLPWYILSAKFGLLAPDDVIGPYDVYLAEQSPGYRKAWGEFVVAQLEQLQPELRGRTVEVHAGAAYVDPLRGPLTARGVVPVSPLAHLRRGNSSPGTTPTCPCAAHPNLGRETPRIPANKAGVRRTWLASWRTQRGRCRPTSCSTEDRRA
jgi:uncharacterized protein DUF6884